MDNIMETEKLILTLEKKLLEPSVRCSSETLQEILDAEFIEFSSSGKIYTYDRETVIDEKVNMKVADWKIVDFRVKWLSERCLLATYRLIKENLKRGKCSLRSSIWQKQNHEWKMIFHQGTIEKI